MLFKMQKENDREADFWVSESNYSFEISLINEQNTTDRQSKTELKAKVKRQGNSQDSLRLSRMFVMFSRFDSARLGPGPEAWRMLQLTRAQIVGRRKNSILLLNLLGVSFAYHWLADS